MVIFRPFSSKMHKIIVKYLCRARNTYRTLRGRYQVNFRREKNHNHSFSEFFKTEAINLKKLASFFKT